MEYQAMKKENKTIVTKLGMAEDNLYAVLFEKAVEPVIVDILLRTTIRGSFSCTKDDIADQAEPIPFNDLTGGPTGDRTNDQQYDK